MNWLFPSIAATLASSIQLVIIFSCLYWQERERALKVWAAAWTAYAARFVLLFFLVRGDAHPLLEAGYQVCSLAFGGLMLWGAYLWANRRPSTLWALPFAGVALWIPVAVTLELPFLPLKFPTFTLLGAALFWSGIIFLRHGETGGLGARITGWTLVAWSVHKFDHAFVGSVAVFTPWEYGLGTLLALPVGAGILLLYLAKSKQSLTHSEELYRAVAEETPVLICRLHPDGTISYVNEAYSQYFGKSPDDLTDASIYSLIPEEDHASVRKNLASLTPEAPTLVQEHQVIAGDGETRWQRWTDHALFDEQGHPAAYQSIGEDITERKRAEQALEHRIGLEQVLSAMSADFLRVRPGEVNDAIGRALEAVGRFTGIDRSYVFLFSDDGERMSNTAEWCADGVTPQIELLQDMPTSECPWWMSKLRKFEDIHIPRVADMPPEAKIEQGVLESQDIQSLVVVPMALSQKLIGFVGFDSARRERSWPGEDIALLRTMGEAITNALNREQFIAERERSRVFMQTVIDAFPEALMVVNTDHTVALANRTVRERAGLSESGKPYLKCFEVLEGRDAPCPEATCPMQEVVNTGNTVKAEHTYTDDTGREITLEMVAAPIFDETGTVTQIVESCRDITDRKQAERERLDLERQIQHAQKLESLGVLAGGIAHDFNNLLMSILGNADLALDALSPHSPARENIREIEEASKRAAALAKQMLAYSGKGRFVIEPVDLGELVKEMAHLIEASLPKRTMVKYDFAPSTPVVDGDVTQIRQVIMNLVTNASEAMGETGGTVAFNTSAMTCDSDYLNDANESSRPGSDEPLPEGRYVYIEVTDSGCGMDRETVAKVFDPFFTTKFTGRGLGLSAVLGIIRGHRGAIKIYSEPGKGTTFKVLFPAGAPAADGETADGDDGTTSDTYQGKGTVLLVDDEATVRNVGRQMLERLGFQVVLADGGQQALDLYGARKDDIACVLLDLTMPRVDGEEVFRNLRHLDPEVTVILCSGYNMQDATQRFVGKGLAGFLQKPFNLVALREKLAEVLG